MMSSKRVSNASSFGLTQDEVDEIIALLKSYPAVERACIFGSRAKGTHKRGSDIDMALYGKNLGQSATHISYQLNEESLLPYFFDVLDYSAITSQDLKDHIDRVGLFFYSR